MVLYEVLLQIFRISRLPPFLTSNLFSNTLSGEGHKAAKEKVRAEGTNSVAKVIGVSKLKGKYESYESKRQLCNSYDLFVADERVLPSLPKLLGKTFFKKKKQPVPVKLTGKDWAAQVRKACEATYLYLAGGSSLSVRVARSSQEEKECVENVMAVLETAVEKLPGKWKGIKALYMKTAESVALPVWQSEVEVEEKNVEEEESAGADVEKKKVKATKK